MLLSHDLIVSNIRKNAPHPLGVQPCSIPPPEQGFFYVFYLLPDHLFLNFTGYVIVNTVTAISFMTPVLLLWAAVL